MISEIQFHDLKESKTFSYAAELPFFKGNPGVTFQPGMTILFGPNGCGKSTILRMAALALAAEQGGVSTVTESWATDITVHGAKSGQAPACVLDGLTVVHDGQPIMYGNPRNAVGLVFGGAGFDYDFMEQGVANTMSKASTGYTTMNRLNDMLKVSQNPQLFPAEIRHKVRRPNNQGGGPDKFDVVESLLKGTIPKGPRTLIFDEPESGLAIPAQRNLFSMLHRAARENNFQIIIATHSVFSLALPDVNYIEMLPEYLENSEACVETVNMLLKFKKLNQDLDKESEASAVPRTTDVAKTGATPAEALASEPMPVAPPVAAEPKPPAAKKTSRPK